MAHTDRHEYLIMAVTSNAGVMRTDRHGYLIMAVTDYAAVMLTDRQTWLLDHDCHQQHSLSSLLHTALHVLSTNCHRTSLGLAPLHGWLLRQNLMIRSGTRMQTQLLLPVIWTVTPIDPVNSLRQLEFDGR